MSRKVWLTLVAVAVVLALWLAREPLMDLVFSRGIDARQLAASETRMWQAYYARDPEALGKELVFTLHDLFRIPYLDAIAIAKHLGHAAMDFANVRGHNEGVALDDLTLAYGRIHQCTSGNWDPREAARAELAWWMDRRTPERRGDEQVGASIAHLYTILTGRDNAAIREAGLKRARAARLRDEGAEWDAVQSLLEESYFVLERGMRP